MRRDGTVRGHDNDVTLNRHWFGIGSIISIERDRAGPNGIGRVYCLLTVFRIRTGRCLYDHGTIATNANTIG